MNWFERFLYFLQGDMERPAAFGWFHLMWIGLTAAAIAALYALRRYRGEGQLKAVLAVYGGTAFVLELLKQLIWAFEFDPATGAVTWAYSWYSAPFQLCSTPIYVALLCLGLKKGRVRDALLLFLAYFTILGGIATLVMPDSCFTEDVLVNIHTMFLHCGGLAVSVYLLLCGEVRMRYRSLLGGYWVFLGFAALANLLNISFHLSGLTGGAEFNMFYISPYFTSTLPVFCDIQQAAPYLLFLGIYLLALFLAGNVIFAAALGLSRLRKKSAAL